MAENEEEMGNEALNQDDISKMIEEMEQAKQEAASGGAAPDGDDAVDVDQIEQDEAVNVETVKLDSLIPDEITQKLGVNLDILMNISLSVSIELGRTEMMIKDILKLGVGSIVELNKVAGEPVDLLVNTKKFAEGEVVVIDENFGIRITKLMKNPYELGGLATTK